MSVPGGSGERARTAQSLGAIRVQSANPPVHDRISCGAACRYTPAGIEAIVHACTGPDGRG
eukprot:6692650-Prymnesium_polylepis.1